LTAKDTISGLKSSSPSSNLGRVPLRVLFVKDTLGKAGGLVTGGTTYLLEVLPSFDRTRIEPMLCILRHRDLVANRFEAVGIYPMFLSRKKWDPRALIDLLRVLREHEVDLLHLEGKKSLILGRIAARMARLPAIVHLHDMLPLTPWLRFLQRALAPWTTAAIAVSQAVRNVAIKEYAIREQRVEVVYNGHDINRFASPAQDARLRIRTELGLANSTPTIGVIGRVVNAIKGQDLLIRAMPRLLESCPDVALIIVGDGPDRQACQSLVENFGLDSKVRFMGQRYDVPDILAAVDILTIPSLLEGLPYVALEAAAAGRPVVAFRTGGIPEFIVNGETGLLVEKGDVPGLADTVAHVLKDQALAHILRDGARRSVRQFTVERHVWRLEEIYAEVIQRWHKSKL